MPVVSQTAKAGLFNVSERLVRDAVAVQAPAIPAIVTAVELGRMTVTQAVRAAGLSEAGQEQVVSQLGNRRSVATVVLGATRRERALTIERKATNVPLASLGRKYPVLYADPQWQWTGWSDGGLLPSHAEAGALSGATRYAAACSSGRSAR